MEKLLKNKFFRLLVLLLVFGFILNWGYKKFKIEGKSMRFTYNEGDTVLVDKALYKFSTPQRGDVIVFYDFADNEFLLKRIIGLPGEEIEIINGEIYIDNQLWVDEFSHIRLSKLLVGPDEVPLKNWETGENVYENDDGESFTLVEGEYWVIGDNRQESWYGLIYGNEIIGKVKD